MFEMRLDVFAYRVELAAEALKERIKQRQIGRALDTLITTAKNVRKLAEIAAEHDNEEGKCLKLDVDALREDSSPSSFLIKLISFLERRPQEKDVYPYRIQLLNIDHRLANIMNKTEQEATKEVKEHLERAVASMKDAAARANRLIREYEFECERQLGGCPTISILSVPKGASGLWARLRQWFAA
jgi:hypothetical protein